MPNARDGISETLERWVEQELYYWRTCYTGGFDLRDAMDRLNAEAPTTFVIDVADGHATLREKPVAVGLDEAHKEQGRSRSRLYLQYIQDCLHQHGLRLTTTLALDVHDLSAAPHLPIFAFQRSTAGRTILLPDIDFPLHNWYQSQEPEPPFAEKLGKAIFVGSSTGASLDDDAVVNARTDRLRLARQLHGSPYVDFHIAEAVQCVSPEVERLLRSQPYFSKPIAWSEQLKHKFLFSVDGNGATCSRVVNALRSQSVLLKYRSDHQLFYFKGLQPWRHYVPIDDPAQIARIIEEEQQGTFDASAMIAEANRFAARFLTRTSVLRYGAMLLSRYAALVERGSDRVMSADHAPPGGFLARVEAHFEQIGDRATAPGERLAVDRRRIEGLTLVPAPGVLPSWVRYAALGEADDETIAATVPLGTFSGSRGECRPVAAIAWELDGEIADQVRFFGSVEFSDGRVIPIQAGGGTCRSTTGSFVTGVMVTVRRIDAR